MRAVSLKPKCFMMQWHYNNFQSQAWLTLSPLAPEMPPVPLSPGIPCRPGGPWAPGAPDGPMAPWISRKGKKGEKGVSPAMSSCTTFMCILTTVLRPEYNGQLLGRCLVRNISKTSKYVHLFLWFGKNKQNSALFNQNIDLTIGLISISY